MVEINIQYLDNLHCSVTHGPSGSTFITDAPTDNRGKGEYISPTDLLAASIGSCIATIMGIKAQDNNINIKGLKIDVTKEMQDKPYRKVKNLFLKIEFPNKLNQKEFDILKNVINLCPVSRSLSDEVNIIPEFNFKDQNA